MARLVLGRTTQAGLAYVVPLAICGFALLALIGILRVFDPANTRNLKHGSNLSTFVGLLAGPRPLTHLGTLIQQLRLGLREERADIAEYRHQLRTEIYYLKKELALLDLDLRVQTLDPIISEYYDDNVTAPDWRAAEIQPMPFEFQEIAVPFYLYELEEFLIFEQQCEYGEEGHIEKGGHRGEWFFHQQLKTHRWRVFEPERAVLFVVPVYLGAALDGGCGGEEAGKALILEATKALTNQSWFQRYAGNDHIFVATHWRVFWWFRDVAVDESVGVWNRLIWGRYMAAFEESFCPLILPYSTLPAFEKYHEAELAYISHETINEFLEQRPFNLFFMGRVFFEHHRGGYATRRAMFEQVGDWRGPNFLVTTLAPDGIPACPNEIPEGEDSENPVSITGCLRSHSDNDYAEIALKSRFHFMIRGDDWTSARLFDAIYAGAIPVVVSDGLLDKGLPFGCKVDWAGLLIRIPEKEFRKDARAALTRLLPDPATAEGRRDLSRRLRLLHDARHELSWAIPNSAVAENILLEAARRCLPEALLLKRQSFPGELHSLLELPCPFTDFAKGVYKPGRHGMGALQEGWNQDD